jgi:hypothetical protein
MFVLRQLSQQAHASINLQLHFAFIGFTKVYDNINRNALWQVLCTYGVPTCFISFL